MSTDKIKLRSVKVEYVKGKYSFKQRINGLDSETFKVRFSGTISTLKFELKNIADLYETERSYGRLDKESRDAIKGLQMNLNNSKIIESKGVTHIIVYECLNT